MFQLAATHVLAAKLGLECIVGFWHHWNQVPGFDEWGGHTPPAPRLTLKDMFPNLVYMSFKPARNIRPGQVHNAYAFDLSAPDTYIAMPLRAEIERTPFIHGYFFNHRCMWHDDAPMLMM